jgi:zinc protease
MRDVIENPAFPNDEFDILQKQTRMGLLVSTRTPEYQAEREFRRRLYGEHPYARTTTGELADLDKLSTEDLRAWWAENLRPDNCVLYVAGDISPPDALALAKKHFAAWKVDRPSSQVALTQITEPKSTRIFLVDRPGSVQSQIRVGHLGVTRNDPNYAVSRVLGNIFGGGFNSRLNKAIRVEKGLTYGAGGGFNPQRFAGEFRVSTFTKTPKTADTLKTLLAEIDKIRSEPPTAEELADTKTYITGAFARERETPQAVANHLWLVDSQALDKDFFTKYLRGVNETTAEGVLRAAKDLIDPSQLLIVVVGEAKKIRQDLEKIAPVTVVNQPSAPPDKSEDKETAEG